MLWSDGLPEVTIRWGPLHGQSAPRVAVDDHRALHSSGPLHGPGGPAGALHGLIAAVFAVVMWVADAHGATGGVDDAAAPGGLVRSGGWPRSRSSSVSSGIVMSCTVGVYRGRVTRCPSRLRARQTHLPQEHPAYVDRAQSSKQCRQSSRPSRQSAPSNHLVAIIGRG